MKRIYIEIIYSVWGVPYSLRFGYTPNNLLCQVFKSNVGYSTTMLIDPYESLEEIIEKIKADILNEESSFFEDYIHSKAFGSVELVKPIYIFIKQLTIGERVYEILEKVYFSKEEKNYYE